MKDSKIRSFLLRNTSDWKYWLAFAFIAKAMLFTFQLTVHRFNIIPGFWGAEGGDTDSYLSPIDNLLKNGVYTPDYRMPGYGIIYLLFVSVFSKAVACNIMIIVQLIFSSVSVYALALTAKYLLKKDTFFYCAFYLYAISYYSNSYDIVLYTESLTTSFLIIAVFYFVSYFNEYSKRKLLVAGLFLTWVIFMRPVFCLLPILLLLILVVEQRQMKIRVPTAVVYFILPFLLCDGAWIVRNYIQHKKILPLSTTVYYPGYETSYSLSLKKFVGAWGGEQFWYYSSFIVKERKDTIPGYIYTSQFNYDSLSKVNSIVERIVKDSTLSDAEREKYQQIAREKYNLYAQSIKREKPMLYYVKAPVILLYKMLIHSGNSYVLFNKPADELTTLQSIINRLYYALYLTIIGLGGIGILIMLRALFRVSLLSIVPAIPLYTLFIHVVVFRECDARYFVPAYPFMLMCAVYVGLNIRNKILYGNWQGK